MDNEGQIEDKIEWIANKRDNKESNDNEDRRSSIKQMAREKSDKEQR